MRIAMFYHSLVSDWNHGNAHFLRGVVRDLIDRGHEVRVFEPADGWSVTNLLHDHGPDAIARFADHFPGLDSERYRAADLDLDDAIGGAELVLVHEWNDPDVVAAIGRHRAMHGGYRLLFHDTHHRSVTKPEEMARFDLRHYDGVLAFGDAVRDVYLRRGWTERAWTWHEAADVRLFTPRPRPAVVDAELVWIGNWGDEERTAEIDEFLIEPVRALGIRATVHGVRYPADAQRRLTSAGIAYRGWLPNVDVPDVFSRHLVTVHIPRRPYLESLPGVPTIRVFEALACGIPLVAARWEQTAGLFEAGADFLVARNGAEMTAHLDGLLGDPERRARLACRGLAAIQARHTCGHRVDELLALAETLTSEVAVR
jgi:spore maturation protein CgeB